MGEGDGGGRKAVPYLQLFAYADGWDYALMAVGTVAAIAHGAVLPCMMLLLGRIIDTLGSGQSDPDRTYHQTCHIATTFVYVGLATFWITWLEVACWLHTGERQAARIRARYLAALLHQDVAYFDTQISTGLIVNNLSTDTLLIHEAIGERVGTFVHNVSVFVVGVMVALLEAWQLALLTLLTVPLLIGTGIVYNRMHARILANSHNAYAQAGSVAEQAIAQVRTVLSFAGEARAVTAFAEALAATVRVGKLGGLTKGVGVGVSVGIVNLSWALQLWVGSILISQAHTNGGKLVTAVFSVMFGGMAIGQAIPELQVFSRGKVAAYAIFKEIQGKPAIGSRRHEGEVLREVEGEIELDNVHFSYPSRPHTPILTGFSLHVPAGATVALVGKSGSGKSTVISLLERFYDPTSGEIRLDGRNIQSLQLQWLRMVIGLVGQEPVLFATSIKKNILYGKHNASDLDIKAAAGAANADSFICNLPDGYDTQVGERGVQLSGGQKQRVAIARTMLKDPRILLLDEATSALDSKCEQVVQQALDNVKQGRTTIIVAHRLSTIRNAHVIVVFDQGRAVEIGTHTELLKNAAGGGVYASLVHLQEKQKPSQDMCADPAVEEQHSPSCHSPRSSSTITSPAPGLLTSPVTPHSSRSSSTAENDGHCKVSQSRAAKYLVDLPPSPFSLAFVSADDPSQADRRKKKRRRRMDDDGALGWRDWQMVAPEWLPAVVGGLGAVFTGVFNPLFTLLMLETVALYYSEEDRHHMRHQADRLCLTIAGLGLANMFTHTVQCFFYGKLGENTSSYLREKSFEAILQNEVGWFDEEQNSSSALTTRLSVNGTLVRVALGDRVPCLLQYGASVCLAIVLSFLLEWRIAVVTIITLPFGIMGGSMKSGFLKQGFAGDLRISHEKASQVAGEAVANMRTVASFCAEAHVLSLYEQQLEEPLRQSFVRANKNGFLFGLSQLGMHAANALAIWFVALTIKQRHTSFGKALQAYQVLSWTGYYLADALRLFPDFQRGAQATSSLLKLINRPRTMRYPAGEPPQKIASHVYGQIEFQNVTFWYPARPEVTVLRNCSLHIPAQATVALVGPSGSGKSSIVALIERFYNPVAGKIVLDGRNVRDLNLQWMRQHISLVQQEPALFAVSIRENIRYGRESATEAEIISAAIAANAHEFISGLPKGYNTDVGEQGVQLSGGQKQRIAIARAVIKNAPILLLDEATSALDAQSERLVQQALDQLMQGLQTTLVITHRLATIQHANTIFVLDNGQVVEQGTHSALMSENGTFAKLVHIQQIGVT